MIVGVPKEIKDNEFRVGMTPESVATVVQSGHKVLVETNAGIGINVNDDAYTNVGATITTSAQEIYATADIIVKVKEPQEVEYNMMRENQILYTYLHLAPDPKQTEGLVNSGAVCIAYETITNPQGELPLLKPMSQVAGRLAIQAGATALEKHNGGRGILLGGVSGVRPANVVIIGGGIVGLNAAQMAVGLGANVSIFDNNAHTLEYLTNYFGVKANAIYSNKNQLQQSLITADLVIGGVLVAGAKTPKLITKDDLNMMKKHSVLVDVAIDQGGCFETSKATTHSNPTYVVNDVVHYCVANMPGAVPITSTYALNNATIGHLLAILNKGWRQALTDDTHLRNGLNVCRGKVTHRGVANDLNYSFTDPKLMLQ